MIPRILLLFPLALAASPVPLAAAARPLLPDEDRGLTCASAFALVAADQARGGAAANEYPPLAQRGREYFVRLTARLMDDAGMDEAAIRAAARTRAGALRRTGVGAVMPDCLAALDRDLPPPR